MADASRTVIGEPSYDLDFAESLLTPIVGRVRPSLVSLSFKQMILRTPDVAACFAPSSFDGDCCWPRLQTIDQLASDAADVLETIVSRCPALTDLGITLDFVQRDPLRPDSCCLSEQSLNALAARLVRLSLSSIFDSREQDLLKEISLRTAPAAAPLLTILDLQAADHSDHGSKRSDVTVLKEVLPRFLNLSACSFNDSIGILSAAVLAGLSALPAASLSKLRSLDISPCPHKEFEWDSLLAMLDRGRPVLEHFRLNFQYAEPLVPACFADGLRRIVLEERAKGSSRLELSDFRINFDHCIVNGQHVNRSVTVRDILAPPHVSDSEDSDSD